jgi:lipopolysaccharide transport system ATP-binding protein
VDEVLAVGDAAFQQRCLGRMNDATKEGRTVLFVSHNMTFINQLCPRALLLSHGKIVLDGNSNHVVKEYLKTHSESGGEQVWDDPQSAPGNERIRLHAVRIVSGGKVTGEVDIDKEVSIEVEFWNFVPGIRNLLVDIYLLDKMGITVLNTATTPGANALAEEWFDRPHPEGLFRATCTLPANFLNDDVYFIHAYVVTLGPVVIEVSATHVVSFKVFDTGAMREAGGGQQWQGVIRPRLPWHTEFVGAPQRD